MISTILIAAVGAVAGYLTKAYLSAKVVADIQAAKTDITAELAKVKTELAALKAKL